MNGKRIVEELHVGDDDKDVVDSLTEYTRVRT